MPACISFVLRNFDSRDVLTCKIEAALERRRPEFTQPKSAKFVGENVKSKPIADDLRSFASHQALAAGYVAAAGFNPRRVLPVVLDVGTDNKALREDPLYMGLRHARVDDKEYYNFLDEFVAAVMARWPNAVLQFEDFNMAHAQPLLNRYRNYHCVFNDDIQVSYASFICLIARMLCFLT